MTQIRSRKPIISDMNNFINFNIDKEEEKEQEQDDGDDDEKHWYHIRSTSPRSSCSMNNNITHPLSSPTVGSWGFDVNRSTNGQTLSSFTSNNNNSNNNNNNNGQHTITRIPKDYNEHFVDISSSSLLSQNLSSRTPTLTRNRNGNEFAAIDRLVFGSSRMKQPNSYTADDSYPQKIVSPNLFLMTPNNHQKMQAEQELMAWQNRMLERDQRNDYPSSKLISKTNTTNSSQSSSRQIASSTRPISAMSNMSESQYIEHDFHESTIKSARVIKRYIELLYHLQTYYQRITDQLFNGNKFLRTNQSSQSIFVNHCRKIFDQLQKLKPIWEEKLATLQNLLKDVSSLKWLSIKDDTTFLQRRLNLTSLMQTLNSQKDLDATDLSIRTDIDRVLHDDKLAVQLQDELSTLLQHQSLLNDLTSLLQWNRQIYSPNEQNRAENVLPLLREQIITTDGYISHVSQQLTELVISLRSLEKYILSYTNTIPSMDDGTLPSQNASFNYTQWQPYEENDIDTLKIKESRLQEYDQNGNIHGYQTTKKTRSASTSRILEFEELNPHLNRDDTRISTKKSNNGTMIARLATVKSAKRHNKIQPNSILKPYPPNPCLSNERKINFDMNREVFTPTRIEIRDQFIDVETSDQTNDRIGKSRRKDDVRKMMSKQNMPIINNQNFDDEQIQFFTNHRKIDIEQERTLNIPSIYPEEPKERTRQVAAKYRLYKPNQYRSNSPDS